MEREGAEMSESQQMLDPPLAGNKTQAKVQAELAHDRSSLSRTFWD